MFMHITGVEKTSNSKSSKAQAFRLRFFLPPLKS